MKWIVEVRSRKVVESDVSGITDAKIIILEIVKF